LQSFFKPSTRTFAFASQTGPAIAHQRAFRTNPRLKEKFENESWRGRGMEKFMVLHRSMLWISGAILFASCASVTWAQGTEEQKIQVTLPDNTHVGSEVLPGGDYNIQEFNTTSGGQQLILVRDKTDQKFKASSVAIPALDNFTAKDTQVILKRVGSQYYLEKIWIAGQNYGYEFPLPQEAKVVQPAAAAPLTLTATFTGVAPAVPATPEPVAAAPAPPAPAPPQVIVIVPPAEKAPEQPVAQAAPPAAPEKEEAPAPPPPTLPKTGDGWLLSLLTGTTMAGFATKMLRRT
jgi:hypothetical protein